MNAENANSILEDRLRTFRTAGDLKVLEGAAQGMNGILYGAIIQYPTEVNAVRIAASISINRGENGLPYAGTTSSGRDNLEKFLRAALGTDKIPESIEFEFVKNLPYEYTPEMHSEFLCRNVAAQTCVFEDRVAAYLTISTSNDLFLQDRVYLFPDEIKSIRLEQVLDGEFTPVANLRKGQYELKKPLSSVMHYISFRGFRNYCVREEDIPDGKWKKDVVAIVSHVWVPDWPTGLFEAKWGYTSAWGKIGQLINPWASMGPISFSGFAVDSSAEEPVLYEFNNAPIPRELRGLFKFGNDAMRTAYIIVQHRANPRSNIETYTGNEIIKRLCQADAKK